MLTTYPIEYIVNIARSGSKFYRELYKDLPLDGWCLQDLPIVPFEKLMEVAHNDFSQLLTGKPSDGIMSTSSGTTGSPKSSVISRNEWDTFNRLISLKHWRDGVLKDGDVIANIAMAPKLSFLAVTHVLQVSPIKCIEIPLSGTRSTDEIVRSCQKLKANVLAGLTPTLINVAFYIEKNNIKDLNIDCLLYGGEAMYGDQYNYLKKVFPNAKIISFLYGTAEIGLIGYSNETCSYNQNIVHNECCIMEIIDELTGKVIDEPYKKGMIVATSLAKLVMPAIRCPTGDKGMWVDDAGKKDRRFSLSERILEPLCFRDLKFSIEDIKKFIQENNSKINILRLQLIISKKASKEVLTINIACANKSKNINHIKEGIKEAFYNKYPRLEIMEKQENILDFQINLVEPEDIAPIDSISAKHKIFVNEI
jgi:phenylacetate-CoA ligase